MSGRKVAVVVAHPRADSFCGELARRTIAGLRAGGHDVEVLDLYAQDFRVAMTTEEREAYHSPEPILDPQVTEHARIVRWADVLVFVYPTWWSGLPAILKGWLERVMVPGVGFIIDPETNKVKLNLTNIRRIIGVSTYGSRRLYVRAINDNGRRTITRALRLSTGVWRTRTKWHAFYGVDTSTDEQRATFAAEVECAMAALR